MEMGKINWKIQFCWVKAHVGIQGNELANTSAKEAVTNADIVECYKKIPKSVVISVEKWQREWDQTTKGEITKEYFPVVADRLKMKINITQNFTTVATGQGNIRSVMNGNFGLQLRNFLPFATPMLLTPVTGNSSASSVLYEIRIVRRILSCTSY